MNANTLRRLNWLWKNRHTHEGEDFPAEITEIRTVVERVIELAVGGGHIPTVFIAAPNSSADDKDVADFVCDGVDDQDTWSLAAIAALPTPNSNGEQGRVVVAEGDYSFTDVVLLPTGDDARVNFEGLGYPTIHIDFPTITPGAETRVFAAGTTSTKSRFRFSKLRFTGGTAEIKIIHVPSGDLIVEDIHFEDLTVQACVVPPRTPSQSFQVSHNLFRNVIISGGEGVASPNGVIWHDFSGGQFNGSIFGNRFESITGALADFGGAAHVPRVLAFGNVLTNATGIREGRWFHNFIDGTYTPGDHTGLTIDHGGLAGLADDDHTQYLLADGTRAATFIDIAGLTGATSDSRYVGATASGAPASGTFLLGDFVISQDGNIYVCTVAGSPGTWTAVGASAATDANAIHDNVAGEVAALTEVTPVTGDWLYINDTSDGGNPKKVDADHFLSGGGSGTWQNWTPNLFGTTTNPNLGTTPEQWGRYVQDGNTVHAMAYVSPGGTGIAVGSGDLYMDLPVTASLASHPGHTWAAPTPTIYGNVGTFQIHNAGVSWVSGGVVLVSTTRIAFFTTGGTGIQNAGWLNATGDGIMVSLTYEVA